MTFGTMSISRSRSSSRTTDKVNFLLPVDTSNLKYPELNLNKTGNVFELYTVDSRYLEIEGTHLNTSRYPYFDISDLWY